MIEERFDPNSKRKYFFNKRTGKSGWSREEVAEPSGATSAATGTLNEDAYDSDDADDVIEEKWDSQNNRAYFVNKKTGQTGPVVVGGGLGQSFNIVSFVAKHRPSLRKYLAGGEGAIGAGGVHCPRAVPVGPQAPDGSSSEQKEAAQVTESS